ncbi:MAG: tripartite ATP-independent periplasmic transporter DctQ [Ramlibacter sp.]|nr:tripartite ATP-independent periplasmic transporter DctQ [Ramlibacter sp.]
MNILKKVADHALEGIVVLCMSLMLVLVFGNVVLRYGFNSGITASEELSRYLFVWLVFLGAIVAMKEHAHLGVDTLVRHLPAWGKRACLVASNLLMLASCGVLFAGSWTQTLINLDNASPVTGLPVAWMYAAGLVASFGIAVLILASFVRLLSGRLADSELVLVAESEERVPTAAAAQAVQP